MERMDNVLEMFRSDCYDKIAFVKRELADYVRMHRGAYDNSFEGGKACLNDNFKSLAIKVINEVKHELAGIYTGIEYYADCKTLNVATDISAHAIDILNTILSYANDFDGYTEFIHNSNAKTFSLPVV